MESEKRIRFKRLATDRTNKVLQKLQVLGNCSNRSAYEYTEADIQKIFAEIEKSIKITRARFHYPNKQKRFNL